MGYKFFLKIDGQFAIAIIDLKKINYFGRDKFGEKPLYYHINKNKIIIGSELKIFKHFSNVNLKLNNWIKKIFCLFIYTCSNTIYKNIFKLKHSETIENKFQTELSLKTVTIILKF